MVLLEFKEREFTAVVLGGDIHTYSVARAFYEEYQIKTTVMGKYKRGPSYNSRIIDYIPNEKIAEEETFLKQINEFAERNKEKKIFLLGAADHYVNMAVKNREILPDNIILPFISYEMMSNLQRKEYFYNLCEELGVNYPGTIVVTKEMGTDFEVDFSYPVILKSSESITYWDYSFEGQEKAYTIESREELDKIITQIRNTGYPEKLIVQDMIPGNDEYMYDVSAYVDRSGKVTMMTVGHVMLEEHTPQGRGNHAMNITQYNEELMKQATHFLESIDYVGFANFDIKYDYRDGKYKFFEVNTRMGRSNYYVTAYGFNVARYLVNDYIYNKKMPLKVSTEHRLWTVVPKGVALKHVKEQENRDLIKKLYKEGKVSNSVFFKKDLPLKRLLPLLRTHLSHYKKFNEYYE